MTLWKALAILGVLSALVFVAVPDPFGLGNSRRPYISRVRSDLRSLATALESYYIDHGTYPAHTRVPEQAAFTKQFASKDGSKQLPFPMLRDRRGNEAFATLTTPTAYLTHYFYDPFAKEKGRSFAYWSTVVEGHAGWIAWSPGPNKKYDLDWTKYDPSVPQPSPELLTYSYDPTNGVGSSGDVFRVKQ